MKRDMDVVRRILLAVEALPEDCSETVVDHLEGVSRESFALHVSIMIEAGLLVGNAPRAGGYIRTFGRANQLTWDGYDLLDAIRSDTVWARTKSAIVDTVGTASLEVLKAVASSVALAAIGAIK